MTKKLFSLTEIDRLIREERADRTEYDALVLDIGRLKGDLARKEARLAELNTPRWQESQAMIYVRNCVMDRIAELFGEADRMVENVSDKDKSN